MMPTLAHVSLRSFAVTTLFATALCAQTPLTIGNLYVVRVGDGLAALSNASTPTFVDEYTQSGTLVQSIALPTAASGLNQPFTNSGTATSEGFLNVSDNGQYLVLGGYAVAPGLLGVATSANPTVGRVIGRIDLLGNVDTSTVLGDAYSTRNIRSVASTDGQNFWMTGSSEGIRYVAGLGATTSLVISPTPLNNRVLGIYGGQLYSTASSTGFFGVSKVGTGIPNGSGNVCALLPGMPGTTGPSAYDFWFESPTVLFVADDRVTASNGGIQKWVLTSGTWSVAYTIQSGGTSGFRGLTGKRVDGVTTLFATLGTSSAGNTLVSIVDTGAASTATVIATAPASTAFRGVRLLTPASTLTKITATCGTAGINATGTAQIGTEVHTEITTPLGLPFVSYGTQLFLFPFCGCTVVHDNLIVLPGPVNTLALPNNAALIGVQIYSQGVDFLAPGACPDPLLTLTDGYVFTIQS
ncbi:MAG: hypothetical protein JNK15_23055 [Planctomycetes bacterium]|nr:hypothetical protein [Planctomycetota bacterium]